jgi:hypothetical protein
VCCERGTTPAPARIRRIESLIGAVDTLLATIDRLEQPSDTVH